MKNILKMILASTLFLSTAPACDMSEKAGMEEVKKKKKKKGFFSKVFGSKCCQGLVKVAGKD